jgi:lipoprotein-anchoring transpeptidase ErfK/SrfK
MRVFRILSVSIAALAAAALVACSGAPGPAKTAPSSGSVSTPHSWQTLDGYAATARGPVDVYAVPDAATPTAQLGAHTSFGSPTTMLVLAVKDEWLKVSLPARPNGANGYVKTDSVTLTRFAHRIDVDLEARRLRVGDASGHTVIDTGVAIGSQQNPTPTGAFFVTDVIDTTNDGGAYGPFALGLSAHSNTLSEFAGGDGAIGIHGTNQPGSIGRAVSHGCVRVPNDVVTRLAHLVALGTPVTIH